MRDDPRRAAAAASDDLRAWLLGEALPTWWAFGIDHADGGFRERLGTRCEIIVEPRRTRVLARQVYVFATAGRLGWTGPWERAATQGFEHFMRTAVREDGTVRKAIGFDSAPLDEDFSLYDQAFALFAFAAIAGIPALRDSAEAAAEALRTTLATRFKHPVAGFEESVPPSLPLKANPHMHLFEAFLAWEAVGGNTAWTGLADEIAKLCLDRFIDPRTGGVAEYYTADWSRAPGEASRIVEPGHQFEWAWLLARWGRLRGRDDALAAAVRLADLGERIGVDPARGVAVNEVLDDGSPRDPAARLWPQTERIKAHVLLAGIADAGETRDAHLRAATAAAGALKRYLAVEAPGLWRDRMDVDGRLVVEPAPASTFYHILCAIDELDRGLAVL
jgi:mannose/cellobiose epimerase-like protein (N-acyl-D-glucosamine 2-epimerase family)